jgi:hypothetical protein
MYELGVELSLVNTSLRDRIQTSLSHVSASAGLLSRWTM